jgi:hypothetical protein
MGANVRVTWKDFGLEKILTGVQRAGVNNIHVGLVGPKALEPSADGRLTNAEVGAINYHGTDDGVVPPRKWLDEPFKNRKHVTGLFASAALRILNRPSEPEVALEWLGGELARVVHDRILASPAVGKPNAPSTIAKKGFDHALLWLGGLANAISYRLVRKSGDITEAGTGGEFEAFQVSGTDSEGGAID